MLSFPNAKINIGLNILSKRKDGFHNLETIFYPIPLRDGLELLPDVERFRMKTYGLSVPGDSENNLIVRAFKLLKQQFPERLAGTALLLYKNIPMGAGLGGGSSDAAFTLKMLVEQYKLPVSTQQLKTFALQLGSDCPFFIENKPCFASSRGEVLEPVKIDLSGFAIHVVCPELHISTAEAFKNIQARKPAFSLSQLEIAHIGRWKEMVVNDFEDYVFSQYPDLQNIKRQFYKQGAIYASLSGTGAALYGIFSRGEKASIKTDLAFREFYF